MYIRKVATEATNLTVRRLYLHEPLLEDARRVRDILLTSIATPAVTGCSSFYQACLRV